MTSFRFINNFEYFLKRIASIDHDFKQRNATLELLKSSILVAFSGALRVYIAAILLQVHSNALTCAAGGLIIYSVYTLDRALDSEEDLINRKELSGSRKEIGLLASLFTFLIGSYILAKEGALIFAFLPFVIGFLYSKGIKIGKFALKLKGGLGVKNLVVGLIWGISTTGVAAGTCKNLLSVITVFIYFGVKLFINSIIYDFKDVKGDMLAGIKTLPVSLGDQKTRGLLLKLHIISHMGVGIALITGVIAFEPLMVLYSFICGLICISRYTNGGEGSPLQKLERAILVDGESASIIGIRMIASSFLV